MERTFWHTTKDDIELHVKKWFPDHTEPIAVVQIAHGMIEHIMRYERFANYLVANNIAVYGHDLRGHGKTGKKQGLLGYFADQDGFEKVTDDLFTISKTIQKEYPNTPLFLFGHSMGSFLVRRYIQKYSDHLRGVILSGTGYYPTSIIKAGKILASLQTPKEQSKLMNLIIFGSYNRKIKHKKTHFDWLTRDEEAVKQYLLDPLAGFIPTGRFFYDLLSGLEMIHNHSENQRIRKDLPMLLISGDADPVGDYSKGVWKTAHDYQELGLSNIQVMLFKDARHELLHELNTEDVHDTIYRWILSQL